MSTPSISPIVIAAISTALIGIATIITQLRIAERGRKHDIETKKNEHTLSKLEELFSLAEETKKSFDQIFSVAIKHSELGEDITFDRPHSSQLDRMRLISTMYAPELNDDIDELYQVWEKAWSPALTAIIGAHRKSKNERKELNTELARAYAILGRVLNEIMKKIPPIAQKRNLI